MLIASIVSSFVLIVLLISYFLLKDSFNNNDDYEIKTSAPKWNYIICFVIFALGLGLSISFIPVIILLGEQLIYLSFIIPGTMLGMSGVILLFVLRLQFEAINKDKVYFRRFKTIHEMQIKDIESVALYNKLVGYRITDKNGKFFSASLDTIGCKDLIDTINKRKSFYESQEVVLSEEEIKEKEILSQIGKEFRNNSNLYKKKQITKLSFYFGFNFVIVVAICIGLYFWISLGLALIIFSLWVPNIFIFGYLLSKVGHSLDDELKHDDAWLVGKHKFDNINVKGTSKQEFKKIAKFFGSIVASGLILGSFMIIISSFQKLASEDNLIQVTGEFEYCRSAGRLPFSIGLKDDKTEYRVVYDSCFDYSFEKEIATGDIITIFVEKGETPTSIDYQGRTGYLHAYVVKSGVKVYLSYEACLKEYQETKKLMDAISIGGFSASGVGIIGLGVSYGVYKSKSKKETIEVK